MCSRSGRKSRLVSVFLLFSLLLPISPVTSEEARPLTPEQIESLKRELNVQKALWSQLTSELILQSARVKSLNSDIEKLKERLADSARTIERIEKLLDDSQVSEEKLKSEISGLKESLSEVKKAFDEWKRSSEEKIARLERKVKGWKTAAEIAAGIAVAGWAAFALKK